MKTSVVLSAVGSDRPGLTKGLAEAVFAAGGNWLESHLSRLGSQYVGAILVELDQARLGELEQAVARLNAGALHVSIVPAGDEPPIAGRPLWFELVGQDRPGIVNEVTAVLAGLGVNIEDFATRTEIGSMSAERLFRATARLTVPEATAPETVQDALEAISGDIMVDFTLRSAEG